MCNSDKVPQWEIFRGLLMNAIYGGHLDDDNDIEKLNIYIKKYFNNGKILCLKFKKIKLLLLLYYWYIFTYFFNDSNDY